MIGVGTGLAILGLFLTPASATESNDDRAHYSDQQVSEMKPDAALTTSIESLEGLALPLPSEELMDWATETQDSLQEIENFGGVRLADDRQSADIYWHGKPDSRVEKAIDASAYPINLEDTAFMPGELRAVAEELLTEGTQVPGVQINATYANPDSSGVTAEVTFTNRNITSEKAESDFEQLSAVDGVPITIKESQEYIPAQGRLDNDVHIGGARIYKDLTMNVCSNAFTTTRGGTSDVRGSMTAAHCGSTGTSWTRAVSNNEFSRAPFGETVSTQPNRDGAIIEGSYYQNGIYIGSNTSDAAVRVTGVANPVQNTEICYSGASSGTVCGNLVSVPTLNYALPDSLPGVSITGVMTANVDGYPAAGNGDSGGPGLVPVAASDGVRLHAGTVISAISTGHLQETCQGDPPSSTRRCSHIVVSTKASEVASRAGVNILTH